MDGPASRVRRSGSWASGNEVRPVIGAEKPFTRVISVAVADNSGLAAASGRSADRGLVEVASGDPSDKPTLLGGLGGARCAKRTKIRS